MPRVPNIHEEHSDSKPLWHYYIPHRPVQCITKMGLDAIVTVLHDNVTQDPPIGCPNARHIRDIKVKSVVLRDEIAAIS